MSRKKNTLFIIASLLFVQVYVLSVPVLHIILTGFLWWSPVALLVYCGFVVPTTEKLNPKSMVLTALCLEKKFGRNMIPPQYIVMDTVLSYQRTALVVTATEIGLFDVAIPEGSRTTVRQFVATLQNGTSLKVEAGLVFRLLRSLSSIGFFNLVAGVDPRTDPMEWVVTHSKESALMASSHPASLRPYALAHGRMNVASWAVLKDFIARPASAEAASAQNCPFSVTNGKSFYQYLTAFPESQKLLQEKMESIGGATNDALLREIPWSTLFKGRKSLVDVGGGRGVFLKRLFESLDPDVAAGFKQLSIVDNDLVPNESATVIHNCQVTHIEGSFFDDGVIPAGADLYFIKFVINDWDDAAALTILKNVAKAMRKSDNHQSQRLFLAEQLLPSTESPFRAITDRSALTDLDFFVLNGGKVRSEMEQSSLLQKAGLALARTHWTTGICHVLEVALQQ